MKKLFLVVASILLLAQVSFADTVTLNGHVYDSASFSGYGYTKVFPQPLLSDMLVEISNHLYTWKGDYNSSTAYSIADVVSYNGAVYVASVATQAGVTPDNVYAWKKMVQGGAKGTVWYSGTSAPSDSVGVSGDFYYNTTTGDIYTKGTSQWGSSIGNIKGPKGDTGTGVPSGGTAGQVLTKQADGSVQWSPSMGGGSAQVNSDWDATSGVAQILHKPTLGTASAKDVPSTGNASASQVVTGSDSRLTDSRTPTAHNHDASAINAGTVDGDRLPAMSTAKKGAVPATGTPSGKYLKDDGTWATPSGGSGTTASNYVYLSSCGGTAINDALNAAASQTKIVLPSGTCDMGTNALTWPLGKHYITLEGSGEGTIIKSTANGTAFKIGTYSYAGTDTWNYGTYAIYGPVVRNIYFQNTSVTKTSTIGIDLRGANNGTFENLTFSGFQDGIVINSVSNWNHFENIKGMGSGLANTIRIQGDGYNNNYNSTGNTYSNIQGQTVKKSVIQFTGCAFGDAAINNVIGTGISSGGSGTSGGAVAGVWLNSSGNKCTDNSTRYASRINIAGIDMDGVADNVYKADNESNTLVSGLIQGGSVTRLATATSGSLIIDVALKKGRSVRDYDPNACSGGDDTAAFIAAAADTQYDVITVPAGGCSVQSNQINLTSRKLFIAENFAKQSLGGNNSTYWAGHNSSSVYSTGPGTIFNIKNGGGIIGLHITSGDAYSTNGITAININNDEGVPDTTGNNEDGIIAYNYIKQVYRGLTANKLQGWNIVGNTFDVFKGDATYTDPYAAKITNSSTLLISGNRFFNSQGTSGGLYLDVNDFSLITGNQFYYNTGGPGLTLNSYISTLEVTSNAFNNNYQDIKIVGGGGVDANYSINIDGTFARTIRESIYGSNFKNSRIGGNFIGGNSSEINGAFIAIYGSSTGNTIVSGTTITGGVKTTGISFASGTSGNKVIDLNTISIATPVADSGSNTVTKTLPPMGNGSKMVTSNTAGIGGNCAKWDSSGNVVDAGAPCGSGGGGSGGGQWSDVTGGISYNSGNVGIGTSTPLTTNYTSPYTYPTGTGLHFLSPAGNSRMINESSAVSNFYMISDAGATDAKVLRFSMDGSSHFAALDIQTDANALKYRIMGIDTLSGGLTKGLPVITDNTIPSQTMTSYSSQQTYHAPYTIMYHNGGTFASPSATLSGYELGWLAFRGHNGTALTGNVSRIGAVAAADFTTSSTPSHLEFFTVPSNSTTTYERMRIWANGGIWAGTGTSTDLPVDPGPGNFKLSGSFIAPLGVATNPTLPTPTVALVTGGTLTASQQYCYSVTAVMGYTSETARSTEACITTDSTNKSVRVTWTAVTGATSYRLYRTTTSGNYTAAYYISAVSGFVDAGAQFYSQSAPPTTTTPTLYVSSGGSVGVGTISPTSPIHLVSPTSVGLFVSEAYAVSGSTTGTWALKASRGTPQAPSAVLSGDALGAINFRGYGATGFAASGRAAVYGYASENYTDTAQGSHLTFETTAKNGTTRGEKLRVHGGGVSVGDATFNANDPGLGSIAVSGDVIESYVEATNVSLDMTGKAYGKLTVNNGANVSISLPASVSAGTVSKTVKVCILGAVPTVTWTTVGAAGSISFGDVGTPGHTSNKCRTFTFITGNLNAVTNASWDGVAGGTFNAP